MLTLMFGDGIHDVAHLDWAWTLSTTCCDGFNSADESEEGLYRHIFTAGSLAVNYKVFGFIPRRYDTDNRIVTTLLHKTTTSVERYVTTVMVEAGGSGRDY